MSYTDRALGARRRPTQNLQRLSPEKLSPEQAAARAQRIRVADANSMQRDARLVMVLQIGTNNLARGNHSPEDTHDGVVNSPKSFGIIATLSFSITPAHV